ncbi:MAG TPA: hypothetical protein VF230_19315 [Acidimicrobiales bacterium]
MGTPAEQGRPTSRAGLDSRVEAVLASPPASGMCLWRLTTQAALAGFELGDVVVALGGRATPDRAAFEEAFRQKTSKPVDYEVVRGGRRLALSAERRVAKVCAPLPVVAGEPVLARPVPTASLATVAPRAGRVELHAKRVTSGLGGNGRATSKGEERYELTLDGRAFALAGKVAFDEFGPHRFTIRASGAIGRGARFESTLADAVRGLTVTAAARLGGREPSCLIRRSGAADGEARVAVPADAIPATAVPLVAALLPRDDGLAVGVTPVGEDGFPYLPPPGAGSFYPVDPLGLPRTIVCRGRAQVRVGRGALDAWRYDVVALGEVRTTTWVSDGGDVVRIDRGSSSLVP